MCLLNRNVGIISAFSSLRFFFCAVCLVYGSVTQSSGAHRWIVLRRWPLAAVLPVRPSHTQLPAPPTLVCRVQLYCCVRLCGCIVSVCPWGWKLLHWKRLQLGNQNVHMKVICTLNRIRKLWRYVLRYPFACPVTICIMQRERGRGREKKETERDA